MGAKRGINETKAIKRRLEEFATRICGLSWYEFTKRAGLSHSTTSDWRSTTMKSLPGSQHLVRLAERFGMSIDWVLLGEGAERLGPSRPKLGLAEELRAWVVAEVQRPYPLGDARRLAVEELVPTGRDLLDSLVRYGESRREAYWVNWSAGFASNAAKGYLAAKDPKKKQFFADTLARAVLNRRSR